MTKAILKINKLVKPW